jgi:hypothetical protein
MYPQQVITLVNKGSNLMQMHVAPWQRAHAGMSNTPRSAHIIHLLRTHDTQQTGEMAIAALMQRHRKDHAKTVTLFG